jgi:hypothetical protein
MQIANLHAASRIEDGRVLFPNKYGDEGWFGYGANRHRDVEHDLFLWSFDEADKERVEDSPWLAFLDGDDPDYPVNALRSALREVRERMRSIEEDESTTETRWREWRSDAFYRYNPVATTALVNLTLGGNDPGNSGNSLHARLRYFDPESQRAGLPQEVAALVTALTPDGVSVTLVNTGQTVPREVVVQAGAYGEHQFTSVAVEGGRPRQLDASTFTVRLEPGSGASFEIGTRRYANRPTLTFPWDRS